MHVGDEKSEIPKSCGEGAESRDASSGTLLEVSTQTKYGKPYLALAECGIYVAWDNSSTHEDDEVEAVLRAAAGRLVLLYLPTYSPWLNPIEMLWRQFRREVTHCELFTSVKALLAAAKNFFDRYNRYPERTLSVIGSIPK